jgi:serine phosphatase RsbU (regulator of sigma subunit)
MELYPLLLVGFGLARRRTWAFVPLGLLAILYSSFQPLSLFLDFIHAGMAQRLITWHLQFGNYYFDLFTLLSWLLILALVVTVVLQQLQEGRRQAHLEQEIRSAQEIQRILIPEEIPSIPGLAVTSVYKPASEVGGDFFQIIPPPPDGPSAGTLVIVGDVSGKGLKAAMTVSLIVGTLRTLAEVNRSPAAILAGLNRRLLGRTHGGFATCVVLRIDPDGTTTLANAGHLAPFRDGLEWELPPSLPLGLTPDAEYEEVRTRLHEAESFTLITDGVLEARNSKGELYGFDRLATLMRERPSAEQVADEACRFGQDDDITVLSMTRETNQAPLPVISLHTLPAAG